ncbi:MAG: hypothetical protein AB7F86_01790 [Bdellovibrionales bacterium]
MLVLLFLFLSREVWSFPNLVRHGYVQCSACHVSPSGGGILTSYGRQLSGEVVSKWSVPGEANVLHGAIGDWSDRSGVLFGGDVRSIQTHYEDARVRRGKFFLMEASLDVAIQLERVVFGLSIGEIERPQDKVFRGNLYASEYFAQWSATDFLTVRGGRYWPQFGLRLPDHTLVTRSSLGFGPGAQFDTAEGFLTSEKWSGSFAFSENAEAHDKGATLTALYTPGEKSRYGLSVWRGQLAGKDKEIRSAHAIVGITKDFFALVEVDRMRVGDVRSEYEFLRFGYELVQGLIPYAQIQRSKADESKDRVLYPGLGLQFFPRPHFEVQGQWSRVITKIQDADSAYLLTHYYF